MPKRDNFQKLFDDYIDAYRDYLLETNSDKASDLYTIALEKRYKLWDCVTDLFEAERELEELTFEYD
jgi:hypothetical protein